AIPQCGAALFDQRVELGSHLLACVVFEMLLQAAHVIDAGTDLRQRAGIAWASSLLKKLARAKGVVIHFPGVILREGEDARTVPGSGRPFLVHPAGGADSGGSSAARDTQARSRGLEGAEP